ncbi:hypothetical protein QJS66_06645 [Kocuria rhizophila]|nr:hypothetical protein QJS66_06645 [Kocuria rhizophila]
MGGVRMALMAEGEWWYRPVDRAPPSTPELENAVFRHGRWPGRAVTTKDGGEDVDIHHGRGRGHRQRVGS